MTIDLERRREDLVALRERILHAAESIHAGDEGAEMNSPAGDQHIADHASETLAQELDETLEENAAHVLREVEDALQRIEQGTYGLCSVCGAPIPEERLDAVPYATLCLDDRRRAERE